MKMFVSNLLVLWEKLPDFLKLCEKIKKKGKYFHLSGLWGGTRAFFICGVQLKLKKSILVIADNDEAAERLKEDVEAFCVGERKVFFFPSDDKQQRIRVLTDILKEKNPVIVTSTLALGQSTISPARFSSNSFEIKPGKIFSGKEIPEKMARAGYKRLELVEETGQFSVRGEIVDIWPPQTDNPLRIVFYGDEVESIAEFDVVSQRSKTKLKNCRIIPAREEEEVKLFDYLEKDSLVFVDDCFESLDKLKTPENLTVLDFSPLQKKESIIFPFRPTVNFPQSIEIFYRQKEQWDKQGFKIFIFCNNQGEQERIEELFSEREKDLENVEIVIGPLNKGFILPDLKIVIITDNEIFNRYKQKHYFPRVKKKFALNNFYSLNYGDYVVHEKYGIGRFLGLNCLNIKGKEKDFLTLEYLNEDKLYVPIEDFGLVQKYIGSRGYKPRLYSLDGIKWSQVKGRIKKKLHQMAKELLHLYATRQTIKGHTFRGNLLYENEFARSFIYEETPDQKRAIEEVGKDMQLSRPMDRLVCGDVGYGKTEIAMRAAFKAVLDSKQVAVLVPTTVLAEQHFNTFQERFRDYPVLVQMLSRFRMPKEQKEIIERLEMGKIDVIIGTHRLLQRDIKLKNLGLLIIDEEQRFGVKDKEKLKNIRKNIDVLSLSATPIPRTLSMALEGIRNMSVIDTPPWGRLPIRTYVGKYSEEIIKKSITSEIKRGGQVFFVHNRIEDIMVVAEHIKQLLPEISIGIAHGRMRPKQLETVMSEFVNKKYNLLLSTTIIEAGLDMPNVNTMIISNAEKFGLSQLYQLRGRIGRDRYQAYVYFFYKDKKNISPDAKKRLEAIAEFTGLGSGFKIALKDLEIRGAGNILGAAQHGNMLELGLELYCKLLSQSIKKIKGEEEKELPLPKIDVNLNVHIPVGYITDANQRIIIYKKMMNINREEQIRQLKEELGDRFGLPPQELESLFDLLSLRILSQRLYVDEIKIKNYTVIINFLPQAQIEPEKILALTGDYLRGKINFQQKDFFQIKIQINRVILENKLIDFLKKILQRLL